MWHMLWRGNWRAAAFCGEMTQQFAMAAVAYIADARVLFLVLDRVLDEGGAASGVRMTGAAGLVTDGAAGVPAVAAVFGNSTSPCRNFELIEG